VADVEVRHAVEQQHDSIQLAGFETEVRVPTA